jgi:hypothetical protein
MKYGNWTLGQIEALINKLGEDLALEILQGQKIVKVEELIQNLFDRNGRRIPRDLQDSVCDPDKDFKLIQPQFTTTDDYAQKVIRFQGVFDLVMSVEVFERKTKELIDEIRNNKFLVNLLKGVHLPIILPKLENFRDYGTTLEQIFFPAVKIAYEKQFPSRNFYNYRKGELANQVSIVEGTRHEKLVEGMKRGIVYGIYFPNPLQGFSSLASREQMKDIPESLSLVGGFDASSAMVMYSDILAKDWHTPGYDLSALQWQSSDCSLCFKADDGRLVFYGKAGLGCADGGYSSGFLFLGSA